MHFALFSKQTQSTIQNDVIDGSTLAFKCRFERIKLNTSDRLKSFRDQPGQIQLGGLAPYRDAMSGLNCSDFQVNAHVADLVQTPIKS